MDAHSENSEKQKSPPPAQTGGTDYLLHSIQLAPVSLLQSRAVCTFSRGLVPAAPSTFLLCCARSAT
jgi:hypothetical protein